MKKKVLCRFMIGGKVLKLVERSEDCGHWSDYVIMEGRKRAERGRVYNSYYLAWIDFVSMCEHNFHYVIKEGLL